MGIPKTVKRKIGRSSATAYYLEEDLPTEESVRRFFRSEFFAYHMKRYSKNLRKAPIYWQLSTGTGSYSVWLYVNGINIDTLYNIQNDYVEKKLAHEVGRLQSIRNELGANPKAAERNILTKQEGFVEELRGMLDEFKRVAPLWSPSFDDGIIITMAPLWRLVPQSRSWQKELKSKWDELAAGKYEWAHVAMHLWPERVLPKCTTDRSLAIAHGLEDALWEQRADGDWVARAVS